MTDGSKIDKNSYALIRLPNYFRGPKVTLKTVDKDYNWKFSKWLLFLYTSNLRTSLISCCLFISLNLWVWMLQKIDVPVFGERHVLHKDVFLTTL